MFIDKTADRLHIIRFRNGPLIYLTTTHGDVLTSVKTANRELRSGTFRNKEFQLAYELAKVQMGLLDPDPEEVLLHQVLETRGLTGYMTGHWLIRDYLARQQKLDAIANIGDWLDAEGFVDITPPDQDKPKFLRVTDIGKYYAANNCFTTGVYPMYILASENNQIVSAGLLENHRDEQPKRGGYDYPAVYLDDQQTHPTLLDYNHISIDLTAEQEQAIQTKPISANGRLYSNIEQFGHARNLPTWFILEQITAEPQQRYVYSEDWHFV